VSLLKGNIFDIQGYSIHDGPGIRTVVFLKGCPLCCKWCANPESFEMRPQLYFLPSRCIGCQSCVRACPNGEAEWRDGRVGIDFQKSYGSDLAWTAVCPSKSLIVKGAEYTVPELIGRFEVERPFYRNGGGITLSGGEPFVQPEFTLALLRACKKAGFSTAVETACAIKPEYLLEAVPYVDWFLCDVKHMDSAVHKEWTGVGNEQILDNLALIRRSGGRVFARTPLIPGVNDNAKDIEAIMRYLKACGIRGYQVLPFHQYGSGKYLACGLTYPCHDMRPPDAHTVEKIGDLIRANGFTNRFEECS
jgi:pyruvate formate lyase activating enzyme